MMKLKHFTLFPAAIALAALAMATSACDDAASSDDDDDENGGSSGTAGTPSNGGTSGSAGSGPAGGTGGGGDPTGVVLQPSIDGWMDREDVWNTIDIQGSWYPYGDQYGDGDGDAKCTRVGLHTSAECSTIVTPPPPPAMGFPNTGGVMCTSGSITQVLPCEADLLTRCPNCSGCPMADYSTMWGAGIGFDLNADKGPPDDDGEKHVWDPATAPGGAIIGIEFMIDNVPLSGLRVEIPMLLTDAEAAMFMLPPAPRRTATPTAPRTGAPWGAACTRTHPSWPAWSIACSGRTSSLQKWATTCSTRRGCSACSSTCQPTRRLEANTSSASAT